jgi:hypothetical protein
LRFFAAISVKEFAFMVAWREPARNGHAGQERSTTAELAEAARFYERKVPGLGRRFRAEFWLGYCRAGSRVPPAQSIALSKPEWLWLPFCRVMERKQKGAGKQVGEFPASTLTIACVTLVPMKQANLARGLVAVCAAWIVCATGQAHAAVYVVDQAAPGAADTNPGTEEKPFKTVQRAAAKRMAVKSADPRLHLFETVVREQGIDLGGREDVKVEGITLTNTLKGKL